MATRIEITGAEELRTRIVQIDERLRGSLRPVLEPIGATMLAAAREAIDIGGRFGWPPLSEATIALRARRGGPGGATPLRATGELRNSIRQLELTDDRVEVGTTLERAGIQEYGGTTAATSMIPGRRVPARPFMPVPPATIDLAIGSLLEHLFAAQAGAARG